MNTQRVFTFLARRCVACETLIDVTLSNGAVVSGLYLGRDEIGFVVHEHDGDITKLLFTDVKDLACDIRGFDESDDPLSQAPDRVHHLGDRGPLP